MSEDADQLRALMTQFLTKAPDASVADAATFLSNADGNVDVAVAEYNKQKKAKPAGKSSSNNTYFAGGGNSSGQAIIGPEGDDNDYGSGKELVDGLFQRARDHGAEDITNAAADDTAFQGAGRRLGFTPGPSPVMQAVKRRVVKIKITFYSNGFVVGDETTLRDPQSPEGKIFLAQLDKGFIPRDVAAQHKDCDIDVELVDRSQNEYTAPSYIAYSGEGKSLRGPASPTTAASSSSAVGVPTTFSLEEDQPSCKVVLVLPDGARQEVKMNHDRHTVNDLRGLTVSATGLEAAQFDLVARDFPKQRQLTDFTQTIAEAKLKNGVVMVHKK